MHCHHARKSQGDTPHNRFPLLTSFVIIVPHEAVTGPDYFLFLGHTEGFGLLVHSHAVQEWGIRCLSFRRSCADLRHAWSAAANRIFNLGSSCRISYSSKSSKYFQLSVPVQKTCRVSTFHFTPLSLLIRFLIPHRMTSHIQPVAQVAQSSFAKSQSQQ